MADVRQSDIDCEIPWLKLDVFVLYWPGRVMEPYRSPDRVLRFGPFEAELDAGVLRKHGARIKLQGQPFQVLTALLENPGSVVTREELRRRLWPDDSFGDFEHGLNAAVNRLRQALGDSAEQPRYIETLSKRGYRFIPTVDEGGTVELEEIPAARGLASRLWTARWISGTVLAVICAVAVFFASNHALPPAKRPVPLTTFRGFEANPALSPDGNHVAFTWDGNKQDNVDVYAISIASGTAVRLTSDPADDVSPAWSPDGRMIAFLRRHGNSSELMVVAAAGGPEVRIADTQEKTWFQPRKPSSLAWSPDGRWIAASHRESGELVDSIYLFSLTGKKRRLTAPPPNFRSDNMPAFSPDGRALAFCRLPGAFVSEIYVQSLDANLWPLGKARAITDEKRWSAQPVWAGDGRSLLYIFGDDASKGGEIRIINGGRPQTLMQTIPLADRVSEIALGRHLVYSRQIEDTNIWRAELPEPGADPAEAELFISSTQPDQTPQYSPDGKRIAFASARSGTREIWVSNADSSNPVRITFFGGPLVGCPFWSPDGRSITFHARPEARVDAFVIPVAGGSAKPLATLSWTPSYSSDGQTIYFSSRRTGEAEVWRMRANGGEEAVKMTSSDWAEQPIESPDRNLVYYLRRDRSEIWRVPVQPGEPQRVTGPTQLWPVGFAVTAKGIYYGAPPHSGDERFIQFFDFSTRENRPVVIARHRFHIGMSVSPDSRYILFDQYDESGSDLMVIENFVPGR